MRTLLMLAALALSVASLAQSSLKTSLQADYDALGKAFAKADLGVFDHYLAKDYWLVSPNGGPKWNRARVLADFKKQMANMKTPRWHRTIKSVQLKGQLAVVDVVGTFDGSFPEAGGTMHVFHLDSESIDTWQLSPRHQLKSSQIKKLDAKIDGKPTGG